MKKRIGLFFFLISFSFLPALAGTVRVITLDDHLINPVIQEYIEENLKKAKANKEAALVIKINTPGGLLKPTQEITKKILNSNLPVITYVWPKGARAASAGTFIGYASTVLAMSPSTHIGAAHPVLGQGSLGDMAEEAKTKLINDTLAWAKSLAEAKKRDWQPLKKMVKESKSFTSREALEKGIIDLKAENLETLLKNINQKEILGKDLVLPFQEPDLKFVGLTRRQNFLNILLSPNLAYLLFTLGTLGLISEITNPGFGFPGIAGLICLTISLYALAMLPVNYAGIILLVLGFIFLIAEAFTPSFGLFGLAGLISFVLGSLFMFRGPAGFQVHLGIILPIAALAAVWNVFVLSKVAQIRIKQPQTGKEGLIGKTGTAYTDIEKEGKAFIHGEIWQAESSQKIKKEEKIKVITVKGLKLIVEKV